MSTKFKQKQFRKKRRDSSDDEDDQAIGDYRPFTPSGYRTRPIRYSLGPSGKQSAAMYPSSCVKPIVLLVMDSNGRNAVLPQKVRPSRNACFELAAISIPGGKTFHACSELQHLESCKLDVSHVVLALGTNDMSEGRRVLYSFNTRIERLIQVARYAYSNSKIAYNSILPRHDENGTIVKEANDIIRCVTEKHQIPFLEIKVPKDPAYWSDLIHLSDVGLQIYMDTFEREVTEKLFKNFENKIIKPLIQHSVSFSSLQDQIASSRKRDVFSFGSQSFSCRDDRRKGDNYAGRSIRKIFKRRAEFADEDAKFSSKRRVEDDEDSYRDSKSGKRRSRDNRGVESWRRSGEYVSHRDSYKEDSQYKGDRRNRYESAGGEETWRRHKDEHSSEEDSYNQRSSHKDSRRKSESMRSKETRRKEQDEYSSEEDSHNQSSRKDSRRSKSDQSKETESNRQDEDEDLSDEEGSHNHKRSHHMKLKRSKGSEARETGMRKHVDVIDYEDSHKEEDSHKKSRRRKSELAGCSNRDSIYSKYMRFSDGSSMVNVDIMDNPNQEDLDKSYSKRRKNKIKRNKIFLKRSISAAIGGHLDQKNQNREHFNQEDHDNSKMSFSGSRLQRFTDARRVTKDSFDEERYRDSTSGSRYVIQEEENSRSIKISPRRKVEQDVHWSRKKINSILKGVSNRRERLDDRSSDEESHSDQEE